MTLGVPRLKELINVSKSIKSPTMRVFPATTPSPSTEAEASVSVSLPTLATALRGVFVKDIMLDAQLCYRAATSPYENDYLDVVDITPLNETFENTGWSVWILLDPKNAITGMDVSTWINQSFPYVWATYCTQSNRVGIRLLPQNNGLDTEPKMKAFMHKVCSECPIRGYKAIDQCLQNEVDGCVDTLGRDLDGVLADPLVDAYKTSSNDVTAVLATLGIEAARQTLLDEITKVIEFDGGYVDYRHLSMLVDTMTYKGHLMAITRHGINRTETGVLMRCSFEETINVLTDAAVFAELDHIRGVTEHIVVGKAAKVGTGVGQTLFSPMLLSTPMPTDQAELSSSRQHQYTPSSPRRREASDESLVVSFFPPT